MNFWFEIYLCSFLVLILENILLNFLKVWNFFFWIILKILLFSSFVIKRLSLEFLLIVGFECFFFLFVKCCNIFFFNFCWIWIERVIFCVLLWVMLDFCFFNFFLIFCIRVFIRLLLGIFLFFLLCVLVV